MHRVAVYPGTFDPLTLGHFDLIQRSALLFDKVVIVVASLSAKATGMFDLETRLAMMQESIEAAGIKNVEIDKLDRLLVDYCRSRRIGVVVRGLRVYSDFEYEFQMAGMNRALDASIETVFLMADARRQAIASKLVKEIALFGGDISRFVSPAVRDEVVARVEAIGRLGDY